MIHKTRGIVLHQLKYSDSSLIVKIYTESLGLQTYLVKGARSKRSAFRSSLFQPMTLLDLVVYHREKNELQRIREAEIAEPFHSISSELRKSTIALFLSEILMKSLNAGEANDEMFAFISSSLRFLNMQEDGIENFHLFFLTKLSLYLGFYPRGNPAAEGEYFDLREGKFSMSPPLHPDYLERDLGMKLYMLSNIKAGELASLNLDKSLRNELLNTILLYYQIHLSGLGTIKSIEILKEVFS
ncbi:MAG: DNA repair protein RecO [Bacteroidetes bacterium]|nr:MAG: DNA repair protein RecO [Bacteroidota bacterium]